MRFLLTLLLALAIPFNAAYAAAASVCDAMEGQAQHGQHLGHHSHAHDHAQDEAANTPDSGLSGSDHNHSHAHPLFSLMLPAPIKLNLPSSVDPVIRLPAKRFVSTTPPRLERPPRSPLVA